MNDTWRQKWNERYRGQKFAYGIDPNDYLKEQIVSLGIGTILFPAEGEGRNAVYAAKLGWQVTAFDISIEAKNKATQLAKQNRIDINYHIGELPEMKFNEDQFDVIALIYAHFPSEIRSLYHKILDTLLRKGGTIIFEAFSKNHLRYASKKEQVGGPTDPQMLFSIEEILLDFPNYEMLQLEEKQIELREGLFHNGIGSVVRFVGRKK